MDALSALRQWSSRCHWQLQVRTAPVPVLVISTDARGMADPEGSMTVPCQGHSGLFRVTPISPNCERTRCGMSAMIQGRLPDFDQIVETPGLLEKQINRLASKGV